MAVYATALPCPGTSMTCDIRASVSAVARSDNSGWDITYSLYLYATNNSGYPSSAVTNYGTLDLATIRRVNWAGTFSFPNGHGVGYTILLGNGSYFLPVTADGKGSIAVAYSFTEGGTPTIGSGSGTGTLTLPDIPVGPKIRASAAWKSGVWKVKQTTQKALVLKVRSGASWLNLK